MPETRTETLTQTRTGAAKSRQLKTRYRCPHCGGRAVVRSSRDFSEITREHTVDCQNDDCLCRFKILSQVTVMTRPPKKANPKVHVPLRTPDQPGKRKGR